MPIRRPNSTFSTAHLRNSLPMWMKEFASLLLMRSHWLTLWQDYRAWLSSPKTVSGIAPRYSKFCQPAFESNSSIMEIWWLFQTATQAIDVWNSLSATARYTPPKSSWLASWGRHWNPVNQIFDFNNTLYITAVTISPEYIVQVLDYP